MELHHITIATADDIIHIGGDVNIYPVYLSWATIIWVNFLNWLGKTIVSDHIFVNFLSANLGTLPWPLSVFYHVHEGRYLTRIVSKTSQEYSPTVYLLSNFTQLSIWRDGLLTYMHT